MLAAGSLVCTTTAFRVGAGCVELWVDRAPGLTKLALRATMGDDTGRAQAAFRDDFLALARDAVEVSWRELRRGVHDLDAFTRSDDQPGERPHRPYRVKP
jgi:hypothetical protein